MRLSKPSREALRYQTTPRPSAALLGPLWALLIAGGIVDTFTGAIGWATGGIWDKVKDLLRATTDWVTSWINHVVDWASRAFDAIWGAIRAAGDFAHSIVDWAVGTINVVQDRIVDWAGRLVQAARDFARGLVDQLGRWAESAIGDVWRFADGIFGWVVDNVWQPLSDRISAAFAWVSDQVIPWLLDRLAEVGRWAQGLVDWSVAAARSLVDQVVDWLQPIVGVVQGAFGWLEWIARHPFDWWIRTWRDIGHLSPSTIADVVTDSLRHDSSRLEDLVMDWFDS